MSDKQEAQYRAVVDRLAFALDELLDVGPQDCGTPVATKAFEQAVDALSHAQRVMTSW